MIEVVCMIYRSRDHYEFMRQQNCVDRFVANDPEPSLGQGPWQVYNDPKPGDHYLSRVYRCWNWCVESSAEKYVCLVNSDMAMHPAWLEPLKLHCELNELGLRRLLPVARLVEPGFIKPGEHAIEIDLGRDPNSFPWDSWYKLAEDLRESRVENGGLFMPCVLHRETFLRVGGYPEGNLKKGRKIISGDADLFRRMAEAGYKHVTNFGSLVYHMQEGEMRHPL